MAKEKVMTVEVPYIGPDSMGLFKDDEGNLVRDELSGRYVKLADKYKQLVRGALPHDKIFAGFVSSKSKRPDSYQFKVKVLPRKASSKYSKVKE